MTDQREKMREALVELRNVAQSAYQKREPMVVFPDDIAALNWAIDALSASGTKSDGGVESRHATAFVQPRGIEPEVAPGPSDPIPSQHDEVEAIARIIDPKAHEKFDAAYMAGDWHGRMHWIGSVMKSRETADAILAMQAERRGVKP